MKIIVAACQVFPGGQGEDKVVLYWLSSDAETLELLREEDF